MIARSLRRLALLAIVVPVFCPALGAVPGGAGILTPFRWHLPGPHATAEVDFDNGRVDVTSPFNPGLTLSVGHKGVIHYPAELDGDPPGAGQAFPLVIFAHGRYQVEPQIGRNHLQASYLLRHLASHGIIAASVNLDVVGQFASPAAIPQRGELVHHTIDLMEALAGDPDSIFFGRVDLERIALLGHSRGGEGVVAAAVNNPGRPILAVATIAPTDFEGYSLSGPLYYGLYGSQDGDVNNGWPILLYDRVTPLKGFLFIYGASHFHFTDSIAFDPAGIPRKAHHVIARALFMTFLHFAFEGDEKVLPFLAFDLPIPHPGRGLYPVYPLFEHPDRVVVDDFEDQPVDPNMNTLGGQVISEDVLFLSEMALNQPSNTLYHDTHGLRLVWDYARTEPKGALYESFLPLGTDASSHPYLSLRVCQRMDASENSEGEDQDLTVALEDKGGRIATVFLSELGGVPYPFIPPRFSRIPRKSVLRTFRIPLRLFHAHEPDLDLTALESIRLQLDRTVSGRIFLDSIEFTR